MAPLTSRRLRAGLLSAALAATAVSLPAATAHAGAAIVRFGPFTTTFTDTVADDCRPGITGTVDGTDVLVGQIVRTPSGGSMFNGQDTTTLDIAFSDGSTGVGTSSFRFVGPEISVGARITEVTFHTSQTLRLYDASGRSIGSETFRDVEHATVEDVPPAGPSDNDVVLVSFEHGRLTCDV
jgi:hypothetical protein